MKPEPVWDMGEYITWVPSKLDAFRKQYEAAVKKDLETFMWEGREFFTPYAKYLIEYLSYRFRGR